MTPFAELVSCLELARVRSDLGQNARGSVFFDARYCLQQFVIASDTVPGTYRSISPPLPRADPETAHDPRSARSAIGGERS